MVVVLHDEFFHLGQRVGAAIVHVHRDVGNFRPDDKTLFIAQVVECLRVLVVGKTDGVGAHFQNQRHILFHHLFGNGYARTLAVLMAGNAAQGIGAAIQDKALLRVDFKLAATEAGGRGLTVVQPCSHSVKVRVVKAVPQVGVLEREHSLSSTVLYGGGRLLPVQRKGDALRPHNERFHSHFTAAGVQIGHDRRYLNGHSAVFGQCKVRGGHNMQRYIAVNAAVEGEVGLLRVDGIVVAVVNGNHQLICAVVQGIGDVHAEGGVAALVLGHFLTVQTDNCSHSYAVKLQNRAPAVGQLRFLQCTGVAAGAAVVVVAAVLTVHGVPGVGQGDWLAMTFLGKSPAGVQQNCLAHRMTPYVWF